MQGEKLLFFGLIVVAIAVSAAAVFRLKNLPQIVNLPHPANLVNLDKPPPLEDKRWKANEVEKNTLALAEIVRGDRSKKQVIFTFDGGAGNESAQKILEALAKHEVRGTFFLTGKWVESNRELAQKIASQGHEIFNHTYSHPHLTQLSESEINEELTKTEKLIFEYTSRTSKPYLRPPYGDRNEFVLNAASRSGYQSVYWTADALDWKEGISNREVKERILNNLAPGVIFLMHIGDAITGEVLDEVLRNIKSRGYEIVSLTESLQ